MNFNFKRGVEDLVRFFMPLECPVCGGVPFDGGANILCARCMSRLAFVPDDGACVMCGGAHSGILATCAACTSDPRPWERGVSVFMMAGLAKDLLHSYKYSGKPELALFLGRMLADKISRTFGSSVDLIMPIPLHWSRLSSRGYNQAALISRLVSERLGIPHSDALRRVKHTSQQASLNKSGRMGNLKHAFSIIDSTIVEKRAILLIDDVMTTGATLEMASRAVLSCGCSRVFVATPARRM